MKNRTLATLAIMCVINFVSANSLLDKINRTLDFSCNQYKLMSEYYMNKNDSLPKTYEKGKMISSDSYWWTSGFFPGTLWYLYEYSNDKKILEYAKRYTSLLEKEKYVTTNHDLGFMLNCSYGNGYRITKDKHYFEVLETGAKSLSKRFKNRVGLIRSWDINEHIWQYPVIIDNMMNLELLMFVALNTDDNYDMYSISKSHANKTMVHHYRKDNSCYHVVSYDTINGCPHIKQNGQGYADESAWSRGQSWGLYGFTMMYRMTGDIDYLNHANKIADYIIENENMPDDMIPYWDYRLPERTGLRDASAAAIMLSALIELYEYVDDERKEKYLQVINKQISELCSDKYLAKLGENGNFILKHSVGNYPANYEIDTPLTYADYYFIEALMRYKALMNKYNISD